MDPIELSQLVELALIILLPILSLFIAIKFFGKGLLGIGLGVCAGSYLAILYTIIDSEDIKASISYCTEFCGFEDFYIVILFCFFGCLGLALLLWHFLKSKKIILTSKNQ